MLERLSQVTLPPGVTPQMGTDWSPVGQIYFFTLHSTNPQYDVMELKSLEDWVVEKNLKSVPDIVDVASFGGPTREYQVRVDPNKLIAYGLSLAQVEQQLTNNNVNAGGSFIEAGLQQINVREVGLVETYAISKTRSCMTKNGTPLRVKDIAVVAQGPKIRLGQFARAIRREDGKIVDNDDVVSGIVPCARARTRKRRFEGLHEKVEELNDHILPPGVKIVPVHRPQRPGAPHDPHRAAQPHRGHHPGGDHSAAVSGERPRRHHRRADHSVLAAVRRDVSKAERHSRQPAVAGRAGFRNGGGRRRGDGREHRAPPEPPRTSDHRTPKQKIFEAAHEVQRPVFYAIAIIITAYLPIFTLQRVEGRLFKPMAWTVAFALLGALLFSILVAPVLASLFFSKGTREWHNPVMTWLTTGYRGALRWAIRLRWLTVAGGVASLRLAIYLTVGGVIGSEFLPHLDEGALWVRGTLAPSTGPSEGIRVVESSAASAVLFSRSHRVHQPGGPSRRWNGHHRLLQHGVLRRPEAQGAVAAGVSSE